MFPHFRELYVFRFQNLIQASLPLTRTAKAVISMADFLGTKPAVLASERICDSQIIIDNFRRSHPSQIANPAIWWAHSLCWQAIKPFMLSNLRIRPRVSNFLALL